MIKRLRAIFQRPISSKTSSFLFGIFLLIFLTISLYREYDINLTIPTDSLRHWIASFGLLAPIIYILLMVLAIVIVPIPDFIIGLAAGVLFPWYLASLYTLIADFLGSTLTFCLARWFGRPLVVRFVKERELRFIDTYTKKLGPQTIFILRLVPGFNFDLVGYFAGLTPISFTAYILPTMIGILPRRIGTYYLIDKNITVHPLLILIGVLISMVVTPAIAYWWWRRRKQKFSS